MGGYYILSAWQVETHSFSSNDAAMGEHIVRLHHRFTEDARHKVYMFRDSPVIRVHACSSNFLGI